MAKHQDGNREKLVEFLDRNVFIPILRKREDEYSSEEQKKRLVDVKRSTESERRRFQENYTTAQEVKSNYLSDLNSSTARRKNAELQRLGLPQLPQFRDQFLALCEELGV